MRVMGIAGWSGSGKTTLLCRLLPALRARGLKVSTLKHAHHAFDVDKKGKDSWAHREAGALEVLVASSRRFVLMHELRDEPEPTLEQLLGRLGPTDLVLVEGFKRAPQPKIETYRRVIGKPPLYPDDASIVAVASDQPIAAASVPVVCLDDLARIADIILDSALPPEKICWHEPRVGNNLYDPARG